MKPDAISGIIGMLVREWGDYGYRVIAMRRSRFEFGGAVAVIGHSDGSRFVLTADRYGNAWQVEGEHETAIIAELD